MIPALIARPIRAEWYPSVSSGAYVAVWDPDRQGYADLDTPTTMVDNLGNVGDLTAGAGNEYQYQAAEAAFNSQGCMAASAAQLEAMTVADSTLAALVTSSAWTLTIIGVIEPGDTTSYTERIMPLFYGGGHYIGFKFASSTQIQIFANGATASAELLTTSSPQPSSLAGAPHVFTIRARMSSPTNFNLRVDGAAHSNNSPTQTGVLANVTSVAYMWATTEDAESFEGRAGWVGVFDAYLTDEDCARVEGYLMTRYGI
jgi:hypothetical protein